MRIHSPLKFEMGRGLNEDQKVIHEARINQGMVTSIDPSDIELAAAQDLLNARVRFDKTLTRSGHTLFTPAKPDSNAVQALYTFKKNDGTKNVIRFDHGKIYLRGTSSWTEITGTMTGTANDRFQIVTAFDKCIFTNGVDDIKLIDATLATYADLGNAPKYKYITAFYNRIVGGYFVHSTTPNPAQVGWSGDYNLTEWDGTVDFSAGVNPLVESPGDLADFITGLFGFTSVMIIMRERSIWLATKQPSATFPFYFTAAVPGKGCNAPYSIAVIPGGLVYIDSTTRKVNGYKPGMTEPESFGIQIEKQLFRSLEDPAKVFGSYNGKNNEYTVAVPALGTTRLWTFNFETKAWSYDEMPAVNCISDVDGLGSNLTVDDLTGTIDSLTGTVDSLVASSSASITRLYGRTDGDIWLEDEAVRQDNGTNYTTRITSKNFFLERANSSVIKLQFEFIVNSTGSVTLSYSKDAGLTWTQAKIFYFTGADIGEIVVSTFLKNIRSRRFTWKLESQATSWELIDYEVHVVEAGDVKV